MARVFITGSTDGLGRAAAQSLMADGHEVVLGVALPSGARCRGELGRAALAYVFILAPTVGTAGDDNAAHRENAAIP
jgi:NAD(P)-dependent dehydrogenase (short-subunit alcohol dehydrogenase family)